ncbi:hypothetical protein [Hydrocarboniphaga effusa]|uniref:hypothetical protein n=1 Tax=Hydrocarboniphaga effusa TaxID=243629 RepID=UPI003BAB140C
MDGILNIAQVVSLVISGLALIVAILTFAFHRRDKSSEKIDAMKTSQNQALKRIEDTLGDRIDANQQLQEERHRTNTDRLAKIDARLSGVDEALRAIPNHRDYDVLQNTIALQGQSIARVEGALEANTRMVERMNQFLMERGT